jgi:gliding motility-associated protein GldM
MALPKEPRQKMINIMYLVLTALLALNVSSEIINAFKVVDQSLARARDAMNDKNKLVFSSFEEKLKDPETAERAAKWQAKALQAKALSDEMIAYIEGIKEEIRVAAGKKPGDSTSMKEDNLDAATSVLADPITKKGEELRNKLIAYKKNLLSIDSSIAQEFANSLPIYTDPIQSNNEASEKDWAVGYFHMTPTVAAITILSKFENDVKNSEAMVIDACHRKVGEVQVVYDAFQAFAGTNSLYLMPGQELQITAGVGAFSSKSKPSISIDGSGMALNAEGVAEYKTTVGGPGSYSKTVRISFTKPDGTIGTTEKVINYTVGSPTGASISADALKVLYVGLDNPLSVNGGNVGDEKVSVSMSNGSLTKTGAGKYIARPAKSGVIATINVVADGKSTPFEFKVKDVPDPVAKVGNNKGGRMPVNDFKAQAGVRADLENFVFEGVKFTVTGFTVVFTGAGFPNLAYREVAGNTFNSVRDLIEKCKPGSTVTIDEISASGPGGTRDLPPIVFNLY